MQLASIFTDILVTTEHMVARKVYTFNNRLKTTSELELDCITIAS